MSKTSSSSSSDSSSSSTSVGSVVSEGKDTTVSKSWRLQELEKKVGSLDSHATFQFQKNAIHKVLHIEDGVTTTRDFLAKRDFGQDFPLWQKYIDGCANEEDFVNLVKALPDGLYRDDAIAKLCQFYEIPTDPTTTTTTTTTTTK